MSSNNPLCKQARKATGLSQRDFAELVGVHYTTIAHWESGAKKPSSIACSLLRLIVNNPEQAKAALNKIS